MKSIVVLLFILESILTSNRVQTIFNRRQHKTSHNKQKHRNRKERRRNRSNRSKHKLKKVEQSSGMRHGRMKKQFNYGDYIELNGQQQNDRRYIESRQLNTRDRMYDLSPISDQIDQIEKEVNQGSKQSNGMSHSYYELLEQTQSLFRQKNIELNSLGNLVKSILVLSHQVRKEIGDRKQKVNYNQGILNRVLELRNSLIQRNGFMNRVDYLVEGQQLNQQDIMDQYDSRMQVYQQIQPYVHVHRRMDGIVVQKELQNYFSWNMRLYWPSYYNRVYQRDPCDYQVVDCNTRLYQPYQQLVQTQIDPQPVQREQYSNYVQEYDDLKNKYEQQQSHNDPTEDRIMNQPIQSLEQDKQQLSELMKPQTEQNQQVETEVNSLENQLDNQIQDSNSNDQQLDNIEHQLNSEEYEECKQEDTDYLNCEVYLDGNTKKRRRKKNRQTDQQTDEQNDKQNPESQQNEEIQSQSQQNEETGQQAEPNLDNKLDEMEADSQTQSESVRFKKTIRKEQSLQQNLKILNQKAKQIIESI